MRSPGCFARRVATATLGLISRPPPEAEIDCPQKSPLWANSRPDCLCGSQRGNRGSDLLRAHNCTRVVRDIDVEGGMHHLVGVVRRRVPDDSDVIAELGGKAYRRFDAGMRDESDDNELVDAVLLELQVQVG